MENHSRHYLNQVIHLNITSEEQICAVCHLIVHNDIPTKNAQLGLNMKKYHTTNSVVCC